MSSEIPTIYEWAGGRPAFERWLGRFYDLVEDDELLAPLFGDKVRDQHRRDVVTWWCEVMGGPAGYTDHLGGYEHMLSKHRGLHITSQQRLRFVTLLSRAADDADLPADPEFRAAVIGVRRVGYASRDAQLQRRRRHRRARTHSSLGVGSGAAVPALEVHYVDPRSVMR
jgi:hemoglobin